MKNKIFNTCFLLIPLALALSCNSKEEDSVISGSGLVTTAELIGSADSACVAAPVILGSLYNAMSVQYSITILANETFNYSIEFYDSVNCAPGSAGYNYTQFGALSSVGLSSTVTGATDFMLTLGANVITPRTNAWRDVFNANCAGIGGGFATNVTKSLAGVSCNSLDATMWAISWPAMSTVIYNSFTLVNGVLRMNISNIDTYSVYKFGQAGYPGSLTTNFTFQ